jgi:hypothetical protein
LINQAPTNKSSTYINQVAMFTGNYITATG